MEMLNRAIEDASEFMEMKRKLMHGMEAQRAELMEKAPERLELEKLTIDAGMQKRPDENRQQYRARMRAKGRL